MNLTKFTLANFSQLNKNNKIKLLKNFIKKAIAYNFHNFKINKLKL